MSPLEATRTSLAAMMAIVILSPLAGGCGGDSDQFTCTQLGVLANTCSAGDTVADAGDTADADAPLEPSPEESRALVESVSETERWELPGLSAPVQVLRTEGGVPHVYAATRTDLGRVLGFVVARDRFFIMDLQRRLALGQLSELLGDVVLDTDLESRLTGMTRTADRLLSKLRDEDAAFLDAYADGVNAYIQRVAAGELPPPSEIELAGPLLGSENPAELMKPFTRRDLTAMVAVIIYETTFEGSDVGRSARRAQLDGLFGGAPAEDLRKAGARLDIWERIAAPFPFASTGGFGIFQGGLATRPAPLAAEATDATDAPEDHAPSAGPLPAPAAMLGRSAAVLHTIKNRLGRRSAENFGSNTWAVAGTHTSDGAALVAGDGHLQLDVPALMYQVGMDTRVYGPPDGMHEAGLLITSLPVLAVGTNGHVAWSQVNPVSDTTDWYLEELRAEPGALPDASRFDGEWRALVRVDETYEIGEVVLLGSTGRTEILPRFETFDGRMLFDIEGRVLAEDEEPAPGESVVHVASGRVVPGDEDGDGTLSAISLDYAAFDATYLGGTVDVTRARDVFEYQEATRGFVGNVLYSCAADAEGHILFTSYQAVPCRGYLGRAADGSWAEGADPTMLLDGTRIPGFTIPVRADGRVDELPGQTDPTHCVIPFDETPQAIDPPEGYLVNANNQPAPIQNDGVLWNDKHYIGGPWASVRADSIAQGIEKAIADGGADIEDMARVQADHRSRLGELFTPALLGAIALARGAEGATEPDGVRLHALYAANAARFDEVATRLEAWGERGFEAASGVETFYETPGPDGAADAVAAMIFNAWLPRALDAVFGDEDMDAAWRWSPGRHRVQTLNLLLLGRGADNPRKLASWSAETVESVFFDRVGTAEVERCEEVLLAALAEALDYLSGPGAGAGRGGFDTEDMDAWLWGLRHQVVFESILKSQLPAGFDLSIITDPFSVSTEVLPLADSLPTGDPRRGLRWFPRGGDNFSVDAASPGFSGASFTYADGPAMRMVIGLKDGRVEGQNIIPGGQSALVDSPYFSDQARRWLGNEAIPLLFHVRDVVGGATGRELYVAP